MKKITLLVFLLIQMNFLNAQQHSCGVKHIHDTEIKNRMILNRSDMNLKLQVLNRTSNVVYVPVTIHLVGTTAGTGFADVEKAMKMICKLNIDFADQNIVFYLNGDVRFIYDDFISSDGYGWPQMNAMEGYKALNSLNIFVNAVASEPVAGYYSPYNDFVFILNPYANGTSTTLTHEVGHFFTLPHTFYGWEGENATALYFNTPVPTTINGNPVENVARNNCNVAADGFCDTDADYISYRFTCPFQAPLLDPVGDQVVPDPTFYMSYASDNCMNRFSQEQKDAMLADITSRGWINLPAPSSRDTINSALLNPIVPSLGATISTNSGSNFRFEWDTTGASTATRWLFKLERTVLGSAVDLVFQTSTSQHFVDVPLNLFLSNRDYRWSLIPYSNGYTCAGSSNFFNFKTGTISGIEESSEKNFKLNIFPNPVSSDRIALEIKSELLKEASIQIFSADGKLCHSLYSIELNEGTQQLNIEISSLSDGLYFLILNAGNEILSSKFSVKK